MNILGLCTVLCLMIIYGVDVCDAECGEYFVIFEQTTCRNKDKYEYKLRPLTKDEIDRNNLIYPCNSTNKDQGKKKCLIEYDCMGKQSRCPRHVIPHTFQTHSLIADSHIATPTVNTTKPVGLLTTTTDHHTVTPVEITTEGVGLPTTTTDTHTLTPVDSTAEAVGLPTTTTDTHRVTPVESTTEAVGVRNNNITNVYAVFNQTMYDVNIIYIQNSSERTNETLKPRNQVFQCKYAEIVCENYSLRDITNSTNDTHHYEPPETLQIEISRDETSSVQPLFTGYFPESANDSAANLNHNFQGVMNTFCSIQKYSNCKQNIDSLKYINIYFETNYVENNTITKYPNCTKDSLTSKNELIVKCEDISFAKHNQHILQVPPQKQELWTCQITEFKNSSWSKEQRENNQIHFVNCSNKTKIIDINVVPNSGIKNISGTKTNIDIFSQTNLEKIITILITEKPNKCSHNTSFNINEGKIIDLGLNNSKEMTIQNNNLDIILSNCVHDRSAKINNKQPPSRTKLIIILKNESLNTSDLKQFNGTLNDESVKQTILLLCDQSILYSSSNITMNTTELHCESIDLVFYNITGIEITPSSQITSKKAAIKPETEKKQELVTWNCIIIDEQQKNKLGFGNCSNNVNMNDYKNKSGENNVTAISDKNTEIPSGKLEQNKDNLLKPKHIIKIVITEKENNCNNNSFLSIDGGKIIDLGVYNNKEEILKSNNVELKLSDCINIKSSIINETQVNLKDLTIILKTESLNATDLQQFNGIPEERNVKQRILLRCDRSNRDYIIDSTSNMTVLQCESVDLDVYNITGIEIITNLTQSSHVKSLKNDNTTQANATKIFNTNQTVGKNDSIVKNNRNENKTKKVDNKGVQKNIPDPKSLNQNINRRKDIPDDMEQNSLALQSAEPEMILLIALLSIVGASILIVIVLRVCTKKKEYNPAPTREPPDDEETAF